MSERRTRYKALEYLLSRPLLCTVEAAEAAARIATREAVPFAVEAVEGAPTDGRSGMTVRDGVAVIPICGPIFRYADYFTDLCGGATVEAIAKDLRAAVDDPAVRAILLNVDSPGGQANGIGELAAMVRAADGRKPVCAYVGDSGCSAAYWLACAAGEVVCAESAVLGSIGAVIGMTARADRPGVKSYEFVSSQSPEKRPDPATEKGKAAYQAIVDDLAAVFIANVASYRGTTPEKVQSDFGRGGVLIGRKAVAAGMADAVGDFEACVQRLSRGERAAKPAPKPAPAKGGAEPKGASAPMSVFAKLFGRIAQSNPEVIEAALTDSDPDVASLATMLGAKPSAPAASASGVDPEAVRAAAEAKAKADADKAAKATLAAFFGRQAAGYLNAQVKAERVKPADVPRLSALYVAFALADADGPLAYKAADGTEQTFARLDWLTGTIEGAPKGNWTSEAVPQDAAAFEAGGPLDGCKVLSAAATPEEAKAAERAKGRREMLAATPEGRAILAEEAARAAR